MRASLDKTAQITDARAPVRAHEAEPRKPVWQYRYPEPAPPSLDDVLRLWRLQFDTNQIARMLGHRESVIYNILAGAWK
jgi:hypothetical protein